MKRICKILNIIVLISGFLIFDYVTGYIKINDGSRVKIVYKYTKLIDEFTWKNNSTEITNIKILLHLYKFNMPQKYYDNIVNTIIFIINFYEKKLNFNIKNNQEINIKIFGRFKDFKKYQRLNSSLDSDAGYFSKKYNEIVIAAREDSDHLGTVFHELNHIILKNEIFKCPDWINEGLSEYFENSIIINDQCLILLDDNKMRNCRNWFFNGELMKLEDFFSLSNDEWDKTDNKKHGYMSRTISWSIIYFLMSSEQGINFIKDILLFYKTNQTNVSTINEINKYYPGGIKNFEHGWHVWLVADKGFHMHEFL